VTLSARGVDVRAGQREIGQAVIEGRRSPGVHRMALQALMAELTRLVIGVLHSVIIRLVAGKTLGRRTSELSIGMTLRAIHRNVSAGEWKRSIVVVER